MTDKSMGGTKIQALFRLFFLPYPVAKTIGYWLTQKT